MTFYDYTQGIPASNNNPSDDQPDMLVNNDSNFGIWGIDHYGFKNNNGGQHSQVTYPLPQTTAFTAPSADKTILYPIKSVGAFVPDPTLFYQTQYRGYPLNCVRAIYQTQQTGTSISPAYTAQINLNVSSFVRTSQGNFSVTLNANTVGNSSFAVLVSCGESAFNFTNLTMSYTITGTGTFTLKFISPSTNNFADPQSISFTVLQY